MVEAILYALLAPWVLSIVATLWSYPAPLEEIVKWGIVRMGRVPQVSRVVTGLWVGLAFGISELLLYSFGAWQTGEWASLGRRLVITVPMHTITGLIGALGLGSNKWTLAWLGLMTAVILHAVFNYLIIR